MSSFCGPLEIKQKKIQRNILLKIKNAQIFYHLTSDFGLPNATSHSSFTDFPALTLTLLRPPSTAGSLPAANSTQVSVYTTKTFSSTTCRRRAVFFWLKQNWGGALKMTDMNMQDTKVQDMKLAQKRQTSDVAE